MSERHDRGREVTGVGFKSSSAAVVSPVTSSNPLPVTGPMTQTQSQAVTGAASTAVYTDATGAAVGTMIGLLKGIFVQLAAINAKTPAP